MRWSSRSANSAAGGNSRGSCDVRVYDIRRAHSIDPEAAQLAEELSRQVRQATSGMGNQSSSDAWASSISEHSTRASRNFLHFAQGAKDSQGKHSPKVSKPKNRLRSVRSTLRCWIKTFESRRSRFSDSPHHLRSQTETMTWTMRKNAFIVFIKHTIGRKLGGTEPRGARARMLQDCADELPTHN